MASLRRVDILPNENIRGVDNLSKLVNILNLKIKLPALQWV